MFEFADVVIRQRGSVNHTSFMVLPDGRLFPDANVRIADEWRRQGLLDDESERLMRAIERGEKRPAGAHYFSMSTYNCRCRTKALEERRPS